MHEELKKYSLEIKLIKTKTKFQLKSRKFFFFKLLGVLVKWNSCINNTEKESLYLLSLIHKAFIENLLMYQTLRYTLGSRGKSSQLGRQKLLKNNYGKCDRWCDEHSTEVRCD